MKAIWNNEVLAESDSTIVVEGNHYFPPDSVKREFFKESDTHTTCPWKGEASYYTVSVGDEENKDAAWYYPEPKDAAKQIKDYVAFWNGGRWEVVIDGQVVGTVDSYSAEAHFTCTDTFPVAAGAHTLLVHNTPQRNAASSDTMLALDAVLTYRANPSAVTWVETLTPSPEPQPARRVELIQGPPTIQPTATPAPPANITVAVLIAYDENANHSVDPAEGVRGIPVRLVDVATNRALAQVFTDESGYARLQVQTNAQVSLVVPYFGQSWDVSRRWGTADATFTLLLPAGNQPGLIP